ncbi:hypothetical protein QBC39DRAFT_264819, partial [Podospora conica]
ESLCVQPTLTISSDNDSKAIVTACAKVINGRTTLQNSLNFSLEDDGTEKREFGFDLGHVQVVDGDIFVTMPSSMPSKLVVSGHDLENITGDIRVYGDHTLPDSKRIDKRLVLDFPELRSLSLLGISLLDAHDAIEARFNSTATTSIEFRNNQDILLPEIIDNASHAEDLLITGNTFPALYNLVLPLTQIIGDAKFMNNKGLVRVSLPYLDRARWMEVSMNVDLEEFNSSITSVGSIIVEGNPLGRASFPKLQSVDGTDGFSVFSNLVYLDLTSLRNTTDEDANAKLVFFDNTFTSLHLPALETLSAGTYIQNNAFLHDLNLDSLSHVKGDLVVGGNPALLTLTANRLLRVDGSLNLTGAFTTVHMVRLEEVTGDFFLIGDPSMDCSWFDDNFRGKVKVVKGMYACEGNHTRPAVARKPSTDGLTDTSESGLSTGAKAGIGAGGAVGGVLVVGLSVWALVKWKRERKVAGPPTEDEIGKAEVDGTGRPEPPRHELVSEPLAHQLEARSKTPELGDTAVLVELP